MATSFAGYSQAESVAPAAPWLDYNVSHHPPSAIRYNAPNNIPSEVVESSHSDRLESHLFRQLQELIQHPLRIEHLSVIIALLKLDDTSWTCIQHLRDNLEAANALCRALPQLYQIPENMAEQMKQVRTDPEWGSLKELAIKALAEGSISSSNLSAPYYLRCLSPPSSSSIAGTISNHKNPSSRTSVSSVSSTNPHQSSSFLLSDQDLARDDFDSHANSSSIVSSVLPKPSLSKGMTQYPCKLQGCIRRGKPFKYRKNLQNHIRNRHWESLNSTQEFSITSNNAPVNTGEIQLDCGNNQFGLSVASFASVDASTQKARIIAQAETETTNPESGQQFYNPSDDPPAHQNEIQNQSSVKPGVGRVFDVGSELSQISPERMHGWYG